jgi:hypothetical protein
MVVASSPSSGVLGGGIAGSVFSLMHQVVGDAHQVGSMHASSIGDFRHEVRWDGMDISSVTMIGRGAASFRMQTRLIEILRLTAMLHHPPLLFLTLAVVRILKDIIEGLSILSIVKSMYGLKQNRVISGEEYLS